MRIDATHAAPHGGDPIFAGDDQIGSITSSGYGARTDTTIAYGFVKAGPLYLIYQLVFCKSALQPQNWTRHLYDPTNQLVKS